jgi:hypothetical protein
LLRATLRGTHDEGQQVAEDGDGLGDDPSKYPEHEADNVPRSAGDEIFLAHTIAAFPDADIDVLAINMSIDDAGDDDLYGRAIRAVSSLE